MFLILEYKSIANYIDYVYIHGKLMSVWIWLRILNELIILDRRK